MRVNDRRRRVAFGAVGMVVLLALPVEAAELKPKTLAAWTAYVAATEARIAAELRTPDRFLVMDFQPREPLFRHDFLRCFEQSAAALTRGRAGRTSRFAGVHLIHKINYTFNCLVCII